MGWTRWTAVVVAAGMLAATTACQTTSSGPAGPAPSTTDLSSVEPTTPARTEAARAYMDCSLKAYYTAPAPISPSDAVAACGDEMRAYQDIYFDEFGYAARNKARYAHVLVRRAEIELQARIAELGPRTGAGS